MTTVNVEFGNQDIQIDVGENTALAVLSATSAAVSAAAAEAVVGPNYANTTAGLAATTNGQSFAVNNGDGTVSIYRNVTGTAVLQRNLATVSYNDARFTQKTDLASTDTGKGASLIGAATGGTVEDAIWHKGRATPIAGSKMAIRWLRDSAAFPLEDEAGIWAGKVATDHGISSTFTIADGQAGSPCNGLFVLANNDGSPGDVVAGLFSAVARANSVTVFGANIIARGQSAHSGVKYVGLEVDVVSNAGDTSINSASGGFYLNVFNKPISGPAMQTGGVSGGTFGNGLVLGGIASTGAGLVLEGSSQANSLVNTTVGTFNGVAITLGNGQSRGIRLSGTASTHAFIYNDASNNVRHVLGSGSWILRDSADATSLVSFSSGGNVNLEAGGVLQISGTQVVRARDTGWTAMTGSPDKASAYATGTVTLAQLAGRVAFLQAALTAHGLIGA